MSGWEEVERGTALRARLFLQFEPAPAEAGLSSSFSSACLSCLLLLPGRPRAHGAMPLSLEAQDSAHPVLLLRWLSSVRVDVPAAEKRCVPADSFSPTAAACVWRKRAGGRRQSLPPTVPLARSSSARVHCSPGRVPASWLSAVHPLPDLQPVKISVKSKAGEESAAGWFRKPPFRNLRPWSFAWGLGTNPCSFQRV